MDLGELKNLISSGTERIVIVEAGQPTLVLLSLYDYQTLLAREVEGNPGRNPVNLTERGETANSEKTTSLFEDAKEKPSKENPEAESSEDNEKDLSRGAEVRAENELTVDDLPL